MIKASEQMTHARAVEIIKSYELYVRKLMTRGDLELLDREKEIGGFKGWRPMAVWVSGWLDGYEQAKKESA